MKATQPKRIGFLGGSFDPIHLGHLKAAQDTYEQAKLDTLYWMPSAQNPLKDSPPRTTGEQRLTMLQQAIDGLPGFSILDDELKRGGRSYTYDTIVALRPRWPDAQLFWIIGADQVAQLPRWHRIQELLQNITFLCLARPGYPLSCPPEIAPEQLFPINNDPLPITSTEIRLRFATGKPSPIDLPQAVYNWIQQEALYRIVDT